MRNISQEIRTPKCRENWTEKPSTCGAKANQDEQRVTDSQAFCRPKISWVLAEAGLSCPWKMRAGFKSYSLISRVLNISRSAYWKRPTPMCFIDAWQNLSLKALGLPRGICWGYFKHIVSESRTLFLGLSECIIKGLLLCPPLGREKRGQKPCILNARGQRWSHSL